MKNELIITPFKFDPPKVSADALQQKEDALVLATEIKAVTSATEQANALAAAGMCKGLVKGMEKTREDEKRPYWDAGVAIDTISKNYQKALVDEQKRLEKLAADFQKEEDSKAAAVVAERERQFKAIRAKEERAIREIAERADAERRANLAAIAAAADEVAREAAQKKADADAEARAEEVRINQEAVMEQERLRLSQQQQIVPAKPEGARVVRKMDYELKDIRALYAARPDLVELNERRSMILAAISIPGAPQIPGIYVFESTTIQSKAS